MSITLHEPEFEALALRARHREVRQFGLHGYESKCRLPDGAGWMQVAYTAWADQVRCFVFEYEMLDDLNLLLTANRDNRITFFIDGDVAMQQVALSRNVDIQNGNAILRSSHAADEFVVHIPKRRRHTIVQLRINRDLFDGWLRQTAIHAHEKVRDDLQTFDGRVAYNARWSHGIRDCLNCLQRSDLEGSLRLPFLGAKSLELLTIFSRELGQPPADQSERSARVRRARELLTSDLARPTTVADLARQLNWNATDLQAAFKKMYGQPIHAHLKQMRLEKAAEMLADGRKSVLSIAMDTGWQCQSRFASAFRAHFGQTPSAFRRHAGSGGAATPGG